MNYFKDIHSYKAMIFKNDRKISGKQFPAGSIMIIDNYYSSFGAGTDVYICTNFPANFKGSNPVLKLWTYNENTGFWEMDLYRNNITKMIFKLYKEKHPKINNKTFVTDAEAIRMMDKEIIHKGGSGSRDYKGTVNNPVNYKQVTTYAYWANLDNAKSGNASVVASHIYS